MNDTPAITVVVCTRNRAESLRTALDSLIRLETGDSFRFDILVIDNGSTDHTPQVVDDVARRAAMPVRHIVEPRKGVVPARNRGVQEAAGEWIAFFDDDQLADPQWLARLLAVARDESAECVGGAVRLKLPDGIDRDLSPVVRMMLGETVGMPERRRYTDRVTPGAGNLMVHRRVFEQVGLFDERCADRGEDTDLFLRIHRAGIASWYEPGAVVHHVIPLERLEDEFLLRMAERMSRGMALNERDARGPAKYPLIWLARLAQFCLVLMPRHAAAVMRRDREAALGTRCRVRIARNVLRDGWKLIPFPFFSTGRFTPSEAP